MTTQQESLFDVLKNNGVKLVTYVPDAGHADVIRRARRRTFGPHPSRGSVRLKLDDGYFRN
jgi:hypothetical protein